MFLPFHRFGDSVFSIPALLLFRLFYHAAPLDLKTRSLDAPDAQEWIDEAESTSNLSNLNDEANNIPMSSRLTAKDHRILFGSYDKISTATFLDRITSDPSFYRHCRVVSLTYIKALASPLSHEFLQFVVEDKITGVRNRVAAERHESGDWVYVGWDWSSTEDISHHHLLPLPLVSLKYSDPETSPSLTEFAKLMQNVGTRCPKYVLLKQNCWWFAETVFEEARTRWPASKIKEWDWSRFRYSFIVRTEWLKRDILVGKAEEFKLSNRKTMEF